MTNTPSETAVERLKELVKADPSLSQEVKDAILADLEAAQSSNLNALKNVLAREKADVAVRVEGKQPEGAAG